MLVRKIITNLATENNNNTEKHETNYRDGSCFSPDRSGNGTNYEGVGQRGCE